MKKKKEKSKSEINSRWRAQKKTKMRFTMQIFFHSFWVAFLPTMCKLGTTHVCVCGAVAYVLHVLRVYCYNLSFAILFHYMSRVLIVSSISRLGHFLVAASFFFLSHIICFSRCSFFLSLFSHCFSSNWSGFRWRSRFFEMRELSLPQPPYADRKFFMKLIFHAIFTRLNNWLWGDRTWQHFRA